METPSDPSRHFLSSPFCFVLLFRSGFYTIKSLFKLRVCQVPDIIQPCQWMRGTAWDGTDLLQGAECQEWFRGLCGTSLQHLTSPSQLSQALTLCCLKEACGALVKEKASSLILCKTFNARLSI